MQYYLFHSLDHVWDGTPTKFMFQIGLQKSLNRQQAAGWDYQERSHFSLHILKVCTKKIYLTATETEWWYCIFLHCYPLRTECLLYTFTALLGGNGSATSQSMSFYHLGCEKWIMPGIFMWFRHSFHCFACHFMVNSTFSPAWLFLSFGSS